MLSKLRLSRYIPHEPHPAQLAFLLLDCREALYGGAAGGGKSDALLMAALQYVDVPGYRALILRRTFAELSKGDALIPRSHEWLSDTDAVWNEQNKRWTFPSGASLEFGHVEHEHAKHQYQGAAYQFVGFDELTTFTESSYEYVGFSRTRRRRSMKALDVPIRTRATGNPGGIGHDWVKRRFITDRKPGVVFIPAKAKDNPGLDVEEYTASLMHLPEMLRRQLLDGDWGAFEGAAYPMFDKQVHVVPFGMEPELPASWSRFEAMDFGTANPTAWYLAATDYDGNLIVADEYYQPGLVSEHARNILARRKGGWEVRGEDGWTLRRNPCFGDPSIRARTGAETRLGDPASVLTEFKDHGIGIAAANNDRRAGHVRVAELLRVDPEHIPPQWARHMRDRTAAPRLYIFERCRNLIDQLAVAPLLPIDSGRPNAGEIVDPTWEGPNGHSHAACRYLVMSRPDASKEPEVESDDPREQMIRRRTEERRLEALDPFHGEVYIEL